MGHTWVNVGYILNNMGPMIFHMGDTLVYIDQKKVLWAKSG
jgi:hypothetical protein